MILNTEARRFARFIAIGVLNTMVGYGVFALFILAGVSSPLALLSSTIIGVLFNFVSTGQFVFGSRKISRLVPFVAVYGLIYLLNLVALRGLELLAVGTLLAQAILLPFFVLLSYGLNRRYVFSSLP